MIIPTYPFTKLQIWYVWVMVTAGFVVVVTAFITLTPVITWFTTWGVSELTTSQQQSGISNLLNIWWAVPIVFIVGLILWGIARMAKHEPDPYLHGGY